MSAALALVTCPHLPLRGSQVRAKVFSPEQRTGQTGLSEVLGKRGQKG